MTRTAKLVRIAASLALIACLMAFTPPSEPRHRLCGFYWLTGLPCPLCGLTRGVFALAKGHVAEALRFNALSPLGLAMMFGVLWDGPYLARVWTPAVAAFGVYGVFRILVLS